MILLRPRVDVPNSTVPVELNSKKEKPRQRDPGVGTSTGMVAMLPYVDHDMLIFFPPVSSTGQPNKRKTAIVEDSADEKEPAGKPGKKVKAPASRGTKGKEKAPAKFGRQGKEVKEPGASSYKHSLKTQTLIPYRGFNFSSLVSGSRQRRRCTNAALEKSCEECKF